MAGTVACMGWGLWSTLFWGCPGRMAGTEVDIHWGVPEALHIECSLAGKLM